MIYSCPKSRLSIALLVAFWYSIPALGQSQPFATNESNGVRTFLQHYVSPSSSRTTRYSAAFVDLNGDGSNEVLVYLMSADSCGSGGCTTLVLTPENSSFRVVSKITLTRLPIRILETKSFGWRDVSVWVEGGGIQPGYEAELRFDGTGYATNPTLPPAVRLEKKRKGKTVLPITVASQLLYPPS